MQRTAAREVREQVLHLVGQHAPSLQEDVFGVGGRERHGDELHLRLLRRARGLGVVAAAAGRDHVVPGVLAALAERTHVVARQLRRRKALRAVQAQVAVAAEQRLVVQRRDVVVARVAGIAGVADGGDDRADLEHGAPARTAHWCRRAAGTAGSRRRRRPGPGGRAARLRGSRSTPAACRPRRRAARAGSGRGGAGPR